MQSGYDRVKIWRNNTKLRLIEAFGGRCCICGYDKTVNALELHHIDPTEKEHGFASKCMSWKRIAMEASKCVLVCSNCHREIHCGFVDVPVNARRFDDRYIHQNTLLFDTCPVCGVDKPRSQKTCSRVCGSKIRCKVDWSLYDLKKLYIELGSFVGIANFIGDISDISVKKRMIKEGIIVP